jgi:hypothetical protein
MLRRHSSLKAHPELGYTCTFSQLPPSHEISRLLVNRGTDNGYAFEAFGCRVPSPEEPKLTHLVSRYSTFGGTCGYAVRCTMPAASMLFNCCPNIFCVVRSHDTLRLSMPNVFMREISVVRLIPMRAAASGPPTRPLVTPRILTI